MNDISELLTNEETIKQLFKAKDPSKYNMKWPLIQETERGDKINLKFKYEYPNVTFKKLDGSTESINRTTFTEVDEFEKFVPYLSQLNLFSGFLDMHKRKQLVSNLLNMVLLLILNMFCLMKK